MSIAPDVIPDDALDSDIAIIAKKGRGKTYTAKGIVERLLKMQRRVLVLDPLAVWWGLKTSADGERAGFPIAVFGGPHGDMPINEGMGRPLARILANENLPAVVDMSMMTKSAWQRLVGDLLDELFTHNRLPLWIVLEEADVFAPQQPREGDSARVLGEVDRIARRGRAFGFRLISITQRPAKLHKDVLTQLSTLIALGVTSPQDRDAIKSWVEGNADRDTAKGVMDSLATLPVGEGWVWAPDHDLLTRTRFPKITTLDTSATPKAGEKRIEPKTLAEIDLKAVREALNAPAPEKPGAKVAPDADALAQARSEGYADGLIEGEKRGKAAGVALGITKAALAIDGLRIGHVLKEGPEPAKMAAYRPELGAAVNNPPPEARAARTNEVSHKPETTADGLNSAGRKMLAVLDTNPPVRRTWAQVAALARLKARGGHFNAGKKALLESGLVEEDGGLLSIRTPSAGAMPATTDPAALVSEWAQALGGAAAKILTQVFKDGGHASIGPVGNRLGMQTRGGHWNAGLKALRDNNIATVAGGTITLTELFQPE